MSNVYNPILAHFKSEFKDEIEDLIKIISTIHGINIDTLVRHFSTYVKRGKDTLLQESDNILEFYKNFNTSEYKVLQDNNTIYIFGAGGTASWFIPKLLKVCNHYPNKAFNIILIDGDVVRR